MNEFGTREELTKQAISCALRWQGKNPERAAAGLVKVETTTRTTSLADDQLGQLGRGAQLAKELLALIEAERQSAGIAIVVHGTDEAALREFLAALTRGANRRSNTSDPYMPGRNSSLAALTSWVAQACGLQSRGAPHHAEALADRLFTELKRGSLGFILNRIGLLDGGIRTFAGNFWTPPPLAVTGRGQPFQHQLVVVVTDVAPDPTAVSACTAHQATPICPTTPNRCGSLGSI